MAREHFFLMNICDVQYWQRKLHYYEYSTIQLTSKTRGDFTADFDAQIYELHKCM